MIKNLLNADEEASSQKNVSVEEKIAAEPAAAAENSAEAAPEAAETFETRPVFEIPGDAKFFMKPSEPDSETVESITAAISGTAPESPRETVAEEASAPPAAADFEAPKAEPVNSSPGAETENAPLATVVPSVEAAGAEPEVELSGVEPTVEAPGVESAADAPGAAKINEQPANTIFQSELKTDTAGETIRQTGLAWSAGIVFFGSIVFMMIFGWFADLLLGSAPWGIVGGILLGGLIGFIQFFRITSQIFKK